MRRILFALLFAYCVLVRLPTDARAQMGKMVTIPAGSPEDHAFAAINAAPTAAEKLALLDKFMADHGQGEIALVAVEQYVAIYAGEKQYDKVFEYADKGLALDPDDNGIAYSAFRAAQEKPDVEHEFTYGLALGEIVARYRQKPAPAGEDEAVWAVRKRETLAGVAEGMNYVSASLFNAARGLQDAKLQASLLERYALTFSDSPYAEPAQTLVADSYRRMQDYAKMTSFAQQVLAKDPNNIGMLLLLADDRSDRGVNLAQGDECAHKALELIAKASKPPGASDEQWTQRISVQQGIAWSSIGQVAIQKKNDAGALDAFQKAAPLLKAEAFLYARNQYRMGFALLNLKRVPEAKLALTQAASLDTPYRPLAQQKLNSLSAASAKKRGP